MNNEQREELQEALTNLQNVGDKIENSRIRYKIDDFVEEMKETILTETKEKIVKALEEKIGCGREWWEDLMGSQSKCICGETATFGKVDLCSECKKKD